MQSNPRQDLLHYLAGTLSPSDREAFELRMIEDEPFSQAIESEEFDLIDDYAENTLPRDERKQIEAWINASPQRRTRVRTTQRLNRMQPTPSRWRWWLLGIATATACILLLTITRTSRHAVPAPSAKEASAAAPAQQDTILLAAVRQRGSATANKPATYTVHPANTTRLQILLPPSASDTAYTVQLQGMPAIANLRPQGPSQAPYLELTLPAGTLHATHYTVTLESPSEHFDLTFNVAVE